MNLHSVSSESTELQERTDREYLADMVTGMTRNPKFSDDAIATAVLRVILHRHNTWGRLAWMLRQLVKGL